ncbi:MAG: helix-hairpin-helix domain-containing protein, partial [Firmicutes bacterium]|nr:helix-hairpin-helix domain-containing protein [Bacillota bacterium]
FVDSCRFLCYPWGMKEKIAAVFRMGWTRYLGVALLLAVLVGVWAVRTGGDGFTFEISRSGVESEYAGFPEPGVPSDNDTDRSVDVTVPADPVDETVPVEPLTRININTADEALLETLPGIGPVKAKNIIDYRRKAGGFQTAKDVINVSGIGEKTFEKIEPYICVD